MGADRKHEAVRKPHSLPHQVQVAIGDGIE
jgi:hypothetical protein